MGGEAGEIFSQAGLGWAKWVRWPLLGPISWVQDCNFLVISGWQAGKYWRSRARRRCLPKGSLGLRVDTQLLPSENPQSAGGDPVPALRDLLGKRNVSSVCHSQQLYSERDKLGRETRADAPNRQTELWPQGPGKGLKKGLSRVGVGSQVDGGRVGWGASSLDAGQTELESRMG